MPEAEWEKYSMNYQRNPGTPWLDGTYTVFGEIVEGLEIVGQILEIPTDKNDRPTEDVVITKASVVK